MKLYDYGPAPSPRRVRIFLAEKGIQLPMETVDLRAKEQFEAPYSAVSSEAVVPCLVLDDGTRIQESMAICRYFEALQPEPALFGRTPLEQALIEQWSRRAELEGYLAAGEAFRNATPGFAGRALPGSFHWPQIPALVERGRARVQHFFRTLEARLTESPYLAGERYSVADITALVAVDFAGWSKLSLPEDCPAARRWHAEVSARPSASA